MHVPLDVVGLYRLAAAAQPQDPRRSLERTEHDRQSAVLAEMGHRFDAAAREIDVGDRLRSQHPQAVEPFSRNVDVASRRKQRSGDKEHLLLPDKVAERWV